MAVKTGPASHQLRDIRELAKFIQPKYGAVDYSTLTRQQINKIIYDAKHARLTARRAARKWPS